MRRTAVIAVIWATLAQGCLGLPRRAEPPLTPERMAAMQATSQAAQDAFDRKDWPHAQAELERLVADAPKSAEGYHRLGRVFLAQNRNIEADSAFHQALKIDPEYVEALIGLGQSALASGRLQEALRLLDQAIELEPPRSEAHLARGQALEALGRPNDALAAYFRSLETDSNLAPASLRIASLQFEQGKFDQALARLDSVVELMPEDPATRYLRGRTNLALKNTAQAVEDLTFASDKMPEKPEVFYGLALALDAAKKKSDAIKAVDKATTLAPGWSEARELSEKLRR